VFFIDGKLNISRYEDFKSYKSGLGILAELFWENSAIGRWKGVREIPHGISNFFDDSKSPN